MVYLEPKECEIFSKVIKDNEHLIQYAIAFLSDFQKSEIKKDGTTRTICRWKPPLQNLVKINVDGAVSPGHSCSATGMVIRDTNDSLLVARACSAFQNVKPLTIELLAIKEALVWCLNAGYTEGVISTDCRSACILVSDNSVFLGTDCFFGRRN